MCGRQPLTHVSELEPHLALDPNLDISLVRGAYTLLMRHGADNLQACPSSLKARTLSKMAFQFDGECLGT